MCRLLIYVGLQKPILMSDLLIKPPRSIIHQVSNNSCESSQKHPLISQLQSYGGSRLREPGPGSSLNGDGFGVGWYTKEHASPCIFTAISPAWNNRNLHRLAEKIISPLFFAHIRAATPGSPTSEANCHPFQFEQFMWMHNGHVAEFKIIKKQLINFLDDEVFSLVAGTTDSEYCFVLFLQLLFQNRKSSTGKQNTDLSLTEIAQLEYSSKELQLAMEQTIAHLDGLFKQFSIIKSSLMNFCVSDGKAVIATRYVNAEGDAASLFFSSGSGFVGNPRQPENFAMIQADRRQLCHIITSEPLTDDPGDWVEVNSDTMINDCQVLCSH
jgi:glutamine amidotransferase